MKYIIKTDKLSGSLTVPLSKSVLQRTLLAGALSSWESYQTAKNFMGDNVSTDIEAMVECIESIIFGNDDYFTCNANESGNTFRIMTAVAASLGRNGRIYAESSLLSRPIKDLVNTLMSKGDVDISITDKYLEIKGKLTPGYFEIDGSLSSQFVSAMMFALSVTEGESTLAITGDINSKPYIDMTLAVLLKAGALITRENNTFNIIGKRTLKYLDNQMEGDWSSGAIWHALKYLGADIQVKGLSKDSVQGDRSIIGILEDLKNNDKLAIDISQTPDIAPAIALAAAGSSGKTVEMYGASRLEIKESNRAMCIVDIINQAGGSASYDEGVLTVKGKERLKGGLIECRNDHRMIMLGAALSYICEDDVELTGALNIDKSYPRFFDELENLGAELKTEV